MVDYRVGRSYGPICRHAHQRHDGFSKVWLVSASMLTADRDDGFKISSIKVTTPAVPEPATWAMLMLGFGAIGASLRRRKADALGDALTA